MRVLVLSQYYAPEPVPKPGDLARGLRTRGHQVSVLTGWPQYPLGRVYPGYRLRLWSREPGDGVPVLRVFEYPYHGRSTVKRAINYLTFMCSTALAAPFLPRCDVIYVWHPPLTIGLSAWLIARARRARFVYDVQDIWPDAIVAAGLLRSRLVITLLHGIERFIYRRAAHVLVANEAARRTLVAKGVPEERVTAVPHWIDDHLAEQAGPADRAAVRSAHEWQQRFVVLFAGNLGVMQELETVVRAATMLKNSAILIAFVGEGTDRNRLERLSIDLGATATIAFLSAVDASRMPPLFAAADALLVHLRASPAAEAVVPTKTIAYLAAGRPIVMAMRGAAAALVRDAGCGMVVDAGNPAALAEAIDRMAVLDAHQRSLMGTRGRAYFDAHHAKDGVIDRYEAILQQVANAPPRRRARR